jgi:hypothetical protein
LPIHTEMNQSDLEIIVDAVKRFYHS